MEKTRRVKIVTGLKCNIQCIFCYYRDALHAPNKSFAQIKKDLCYAYRHGIREVDFSGGEPTVHPQLPELISTAKEIGMEKVCIISNGWRLADRDYLHSLKDAGLDEILFSLHGPNEEIHEQLTDTKGSFARISKAFHNAAEEGVQIRTNTVVNRINFDHLIEVGEFVLKYNPIQVNFITINDWCYAKNLVEKLMLTYSEMSGPLQKVCDLLEPHVPAVNVRYIPFCFMRGYERFVCDHRQVIYDPYEWVHRVRARLEEGTSLLRYLGKIGYGFFVAGGWKCLFRGSVSDLLDECVVEGLRKWFYVKGADCRKCRFFEICDGVERTYSSEFRLDELIPVTGERINNPVFFRIEGKGARN